MLRRQFVSLEFRFQVVVLSSPPRDLRDVLFTCSTAAAMYTYHRLYGYLMAIGNVFLLLILPHRLMCCDIDSHPVIQSF